MTTYRMMLERALRTYEAMTPEQRKAHDDAQRASWMRGMTQGCEHGIRDFESCPQCRAKE